jgi:hypothetical protein
MPTELEKIHVRVAEVENKHTTEAGKLSALAVEASNALVDLGMPPIRDVPQLLKTAKEVLKATCVILEHL